MATQRKKDSSLDSKYSRHHCLCFRRRHPWTARTPVRTVDTRYLTGTSDSSSAPGGGSHGLSAISLVLILGAKNNARQILGAGPPNSTPLREGSFMQWASDAVCG